jgi:hypothetical protein
MLFTAIHKWIIINFFKKFTIYNKILTVLNSQVLSSPCDRAHLTRETKLFMWSSNCVNKINETIHSIINNFQILFSNYPIIKFNNILGSLISCKIDNLIEKTNSIAFSSFEYL